MRAYREMQDARMLPPAPPPPHTHTHMGAWVGGMVALRHSSRMPTLFLHAMAHCYFTYQRTRTSRCKPPPFPRGARGDNRMGCTQVNRYMHPAHDDRITAPSLMRAKGAHMHMTLRMPCCRRSRPLATRGLPHGSLPLRCCQRLTTAAPRWHPGWRTTLPSALRLSLVQQA